MPLGGVACETERTEKGERLIWPKETGVMSVKQVIAVRDDLGMNRGKIAAQAAHASMLFLLDGLRDRRSWTAAESLWLSGHVELSRRNANLVQTL
jgi:hypothetical protein